MRGDFVYEQNAADDKEGWSCGLGAPAFWRHTRCALLARQDNRGVETLVRKLLRARTRRLMCRWHHECWLGSGLRRVAVCGGWRVPVGTATFGGSAAAHKEFDVVINCGCERRPAGGGSPTSRSVKYLLPGVRPACHHTGRS